MMPIPRRGPSRSIPKPFKRPSVNLDRAPREWRTILAIELEVGDTVSGAGQIEALIKVGNLIAMRNVIGERHEWFLADEVYAFVRKQ